MPRSPEGVGQSQAAEAGVSSNRHRGIEVRTIDLLTVTAGIISAIWVVSDDLRLLRQLGTVKLA